MKILVDMNLPPMWADFLQSSGFEAQHWSSIGAANASDHTIFAWASEAGYIVFTHDLDFGTLLRHTAANGPSVVQIRISDITPQAIGPLVVESLRKAGEALKTGALVTIEPKRTRVRILPLA